MMPAEPRTTIQQGQRNKLRMPYQSHFSGKAWDILHLNAMGPVHQVFSLIDHTQDII